MKQIKVGIIGCGHFPTAQHMPYCRDLESIELWHCCDLSEERRQAFRLSNLYPNGIGKLPHTDPPADLDWDMWLGPRALRPYQDNIAPYKFRWWQSYSSQMGNWGVHYLDAMRWCLGEEMPTSVCARSGRKITSRFGNKSENRNPKQISNTQIERIESGPALPPPVFVIFALRYSCLFWFS